MNPRHLRYFIAVVDHGGMGRAADALRIAQPSLSQAIRHLERDLHVSLFERRGRGLRLTDAGRALLAPARQALQDLETARESVNAVRGLVTGTVKISALPSLCLEPLPELIAKFRRRYQGLRVLCDVAFDSAHVLDAVRAAESDIGLAVDTRPADGVVLHPIAEMEIFLALPPRIGAAADPVTLDALGHLPFVAGVPGTRTRALLDDVIAADSAIEVAAEVTDRGMVVPLVLNGVGCAFVAPPYAEAARRGVATIRRLDPAVTFPIQLIHRTGSLAPSTDAFVQLCLASVTA